MVKTGWKRRLMAGLLCASLVFQNLSISASATGSTDVESVTESVENDTAEDAETEEAKTETSLTESSTSEDGTGGKQTEAAQETITAEETDAPQEDDDSKEEIIEDEQLQAATEPTEDTTVVKMVSDAGSFVGAIGVSELEIKGVNRNNAKWVEFKPAAAGTYHIYTTNDGTNTNGDPLVGIYTQKNDKVEKDKAAKDGDENLLIKNNNEGHNYSNFYASITVSKEDITDNKSWFIFAGSESSETNEQTSYKLHAEKEGPTEGGTAQNVEAPDRPVKVSGVSQYRYRWLSFTAPEDGIYHFETTGDDKDEGNVETYRERKDDPDAVEAGAKFDSDFITMKKGQTIYARAFAAEDNRDYTDYEDKEDQKRRKYDTVSFDVKVVTAAKTDSFEVKKSSITSDSVKFTVRYVGDIAFTKKYSISYKKHDEAEDKYSEPDDLDASYAYEITGLEPGTVYDVKIFASSNACMKESAAEDAKDFALVLTNSFATKTKKPVTYNLVETIGAYTLRAVTEPITGGFKITGLKVDKSGADNENPANVTVAVSYKESTAEDNEYENIYTKSVPLGADISLTESDWRKDGLYLGADYKLKFEITEGADTQTIEKVIQAGNWPVTLNPVEKRGYKSFVLDFSQIAVKPESAIVIGANDTGKPISFGEVSTADAEKVYSFEIDDGIADTDFYDLILIVTESDEDGNTNEGRMKLATKLNGWKTEDIKADIGTPTYNEEKAGINVPVSITAPTDAMPYLAVDATFTSKQDGTSYSSEKMPLKGGNATLVIPGLDAGAEGTITVTVCEDGFLGTCTEETKYDTVLVSYTPREEKDGKEEDKVYTVGQSGLYEAALDVTPEIDSAAYSMSVSKLRLGGKVKAAIEYASETKADADNNIDAVTAVKNLEDGKGEESGKRTFTFDEGKDPVPQQGTLTGLEPDYEYAYRLKLYDENDVLLKTSEIKTFRTKSISELKIEQSVKYGEEKDRFQKITLSLKFNMTVNNTTADKVTVKYRRNESGKTPEAWDVAEEITDWEPDPLDKNKITVKFDITDLVPRARYDWLVTAYDGEAISEAAISSTERQFDIPVPELTVKEEPGRYDAKLILSSKDIKDYLDAAGNRELVLYYTDDTAKYKNINEETTAADLEGMESVTITSDDFNENDYTHQEIAEIALENLKASATYYYAIYIPSDAYGDYVSLTADGRFTTNIALTEEQFKVIKVEESEGYAKYNLVYSYASVPEDVDIENEVADGDEFVFGTNEDGKGEKKGTAYAKGLIVKAKVSDGAETPTYTYVSQNLDLSNADADITVDEKNHTIALTVTYDSLRRWLGETETDFKLISEISIEPYITLKGGGQENPDTKEYTKRDLIIRAGASSAAFKSLSDSKVEITASTQIVNTTTNGVELTIEGQVSPTYLADGNVYAGAVIYKMKDGITEQEPVEITPVKINNRTGKFNKLTRTNIEYASKYTVNLFVATENKIQTSEGKINSAAYANCSKIIELGTVETKEDFVASIPVNVKNNSAELLVWSRKGAQSGFTVAVAKKENNPALFAKDTADDFDAAVNQYQIADGWNNYGVDATSDALLTGKTIQNLASNTDYVYAVAKLVNGKYTYISGGSFKTKKYADAQEPYEYGYAFYKGKVTDTEANFTATIAPKYTNSQNSYTIRMIYYVKGDEKNKLQKDTTYTRPVQPIKLEKLKPDTEYIVEKIEILRYNGELLETYIPEPDSEVPEKSVLDFKTEVKPKNGTLREGSAKLEYEEGTLRTDAFSVKAEFIYEDDKALSPFQVSVYDGETVVFTRRDIKLNGKEVVAPDGSMSYEYEVTNIRFAGLQPNKVYTVKAEMLEDTGTVVIAQTTVTTLEDIEYDLSGDSYVKDASLRAHIVKELEDKDIELRDNKVKRSEIEEANITAFTVNADSLSKELPPIKTLEGIDILGQLKELTVSHQDLENVDAVGRLASLTKLDISFNELTTIPDLRSCTKLTELNISANKVPEATFDKVTFINEAGNAVERCRNIGIAHVATVTTDNQRNSSWTLDAKAFDTIAGVDPKIEAFVEGYRTDRKYKAVVTIGTVSETIYVDSLAADEAPKNSTFCKLYFKQVTLAPGSYTMKVTITSEEEYNFGAEAAVMESALVINEPVKFEDATLEAELKKLCIDNKQAVADIKELTLVKGAADTAITSLKGIEVLARLETLVVRGHSVTDATPIASIETLEKVNLSHNAIATVPDFDLPELTYLDLSYNALTAIPNLERCDDMVEHGQNQQLVLDYRWNFIATPEEVFTRTNYRIPEYFRYLNGWLAKQAMCQRGEGEDSSLIMEITDSTFAAAGEKLNSRIVVNGLEYGTSFDDDNTGNNRTDNTFTMNIRENGKVVDTATGVYVHKKDEYPYHYFKFNDLKLADGEHKLTFEVCSPKQNNYGTIGSLEKDVIVRRNVIEDKALREFFTTGEVVADADNATDKTMYIVRIADSNTDTADKLAMDEIQRFVYEGAIGREPARSLKGIQYMTALKHFIVKGNELENTTVNEWFTELGKLAGIAGDSEATVNAPKVDLSYNNLTLAPEGFDANVNYNRIMEGENLAELQRDYQISAEDIYYKVTEHNTTPVYIEPEGVKVDNKNYGTVREFRKYRFELTEGSKVVGTAEGPVATEDTAAYKAIAGEATKLGIYFEDTKLAAGEHKLKLTATDDLGQKTEYGEFTIVVAEPVTWATLQTQTNGNLLTTDNKIAVMLSAPYLRETEAFKSLTLTLTPENEAATVIGTYSADGTSANMGERKTDPETLYNSKLSRHMPSVMRLVKKVQFSGTVDVIEPLQDGALYKVVVETTAGRTLTAEGVRFGLDGKRDITNVALRSAYDSTGDFIYIRVDGIGLDFEKLVPVLYSKNRVELTDTATAKKVEVHQVSGNNSGWVVYKLAKIHKPIWEGDDPSDDLFTSHGGVNNEIAYEIQLSEDYEIQPELSAKLSGYIKDYQQNNQSIALKVYSAVFNYVTGEIEVDFGEKASSDPITLTAVTPKTVGAAINPPFTNIEATANNGIAYYDMTRFDIKAGTYTLSFRNEFDDKDNAKITNYDITFVSDYKGPAKVEIVTTEGSISTYLVKEDGAAEDGTEDVTEFFEEGTKKIGYEVSLHSDIYNHLAPYKYRLVLSGTGENGETVHNATKVINLSAPDENGDMKARGVIETETPLTVGGNRDAIGNAYTITLQYQGSDRNNLWDNVYTLHTDIDGTKNRPGTIIQSNIYVYAPYAKTGKALASSIGLNDDTKRMNIRTNNAGELATNGYGVDLTYLDGTKENKPVSDVTVSGNVVTLDLSGILSDKACWIDATYGEKQERFYDQYAPEKLYGVSKGQDKHDVYYNIHERLRFLVDSYGYYYGCTGSEGGMTVRISNVTDTETYKELTSSDTRYEFSDKDLKGLDTTKVYCLTVKDQSGNVLTEYGNIGISPDLGKVPKAIKLNRDYVKLNRATGDTVQLTAAVSGGDREIVWSSTDTTIATVDQNGLVRAVNSAVESGGKQPKPETVIIEAVSRYGEGKVKAECIVEVHNFTVTTVIGTGAAKNDELVLDTDKEIQDTLRLQSSWDGNPNESGVEYSTQDTDVIDIKGGVISPVGVGSAVIKAERDGYTAYCNVTVTIPIKGAMMTFEGEDVTSATLVEGHGETANGGIEYRLDWKASPAGAATGGYTPYFTSSRPDLVAVENTANGKWHLVAIKPTNDEEVVITLNVVRVHTDTAGEATPPSIHVDKIVATDTMKVSVLRNAELSENYEPAPDTVTVYTDIVASGKKKTNLTLGDVLLPEGWRWTDDTTTALYEGTITDFEAVYEESGYAPIARKRTAEGIYPANPIQVWVGTAQAPQIVSERNGRSFITKTDDNRKSGLALNVAAGNVSAENNAVLDTDTLHYTLKLTNENGLGITHDELTNTRRNPRWFYVEAGTAEPGEQTVTLTATYECEWIYNAHDGIPKQYKAWNTDTVLTVDGTYKVVTDSVVDTVRLERSVKDSVNTKPVRMRATAAQTLAAGAEYTYTVIAYDQWGKKMEDAQFTWNCEDSEVLSVSGQGLTADVTASQGGGKTILTYTAQDDGGFTAAMPVEVVNAEPHVEGVKADVNTLVDYDNYPGMGDTIAIIPAYEESLTGTPVITKDDGENATVSDKFMLVQQSNRETRQNYHVVPKKGAEVSKSDSGNYFIRTSTDLGYYFAPIKISVTAKKPSVSIKQTDKVNLFYKHDTGNIRVTVNGDIWTKTPEADLDKKITWGSEPEDGQPGFVLAANGGRLNKGKTEYDITVRQQLIELDAKGKFSDKNLLQGELEIQIPGYKEPVKKKLSIGTMYKAPVYTIYGTPDLYDFDLTKYTAKGKVNMCPEIGWSQGRTIVRVAAQDQTEIQDWLQQSGTLARKWNSQNVNGNTDRTTPRNMVTMYDYVTWKNRNVTVKIFNMQNDATDYLHIITSLTKGVSDTLEFHSSEWRGTVQAKLSIQMVKPSLMLRKPTITVNKNYTGEIYTYGGNNYRTELSFKNFANGLGAPAVSVRGDKKSQALLDNGVLKVTCTLNAPKNGDLAQGGLVNVTLSNDSALRQTLKNGSYKFTLTPYFQSAGDTNQGRKTFKSATLTVKVVDKEIQAKASVKGKLDLLKVYGYNHNDEIDETGNEYKNEFKNLIKDSYVELNTKFSNIDIEDDPIRAITTNVNTTGVRLIGEYADQFTIERLREQTPKKDIDHYIIRRSDLSYSNNEATDEKNIRRKLYAKESYKLQAVYRLQSGIEVTTEPFVIKPVQSTPKITMDIKAAELYASSTGADRNGIPVIITIPEGYGYNYRTVRQNGQDEGTLHEPENLNIRIGTPDDEENYELNYQDAEYIRETGETRLVYRFNIANGRGSYVKTTNKGVNGKLAFTYELRGRDRKSKDATTAIKLTVKR